MTFHTVEDDIREILEYNETARADDMALYADYVYMKTEKLGLGDSWLRKVFSDNRFRIMHGIAPYETVSRIRRKIQAKEIDLKPTKAAIEERKTYERNYRKYARERGYK